MADNDYTITGAGFGYDIRATQGGFIEVSTDGGITWVHTTTLTEATAYARRQQAAYQREHQLRVEAEANRRREMENRRDRERAAEARARELLIRLLSPAQRKTFDTERYIDATAPSGRTYRIDCSHSFSGNITWMDGDAEPRGTFCVYPDPYLTSGEPHIMFHPVCRVLPRHDAFLGQLLLITTDEQRFLETAVFSGAVHPTRGPMPRRGWDW